MSSKFQFNINPKAISTGMTATKFIIDTISNLATKHGRRKRQLNARFVDDKLDEEVEERVKESFDRIISDYSLDKFARDRARQEVVGRTARDFCREAAATGNQQKLVPETAVRSSLERCWARRFREKILSTKMRCDGRYVNQLRLVKCETNLHEPLHGSALFQR